MGINALAALATTMTLLAASLPAADEAAQRPLGLMVDDRGTLLLEGKPFMGIGIQYQNCFSRRLLDPEDTSYREGFEELASYGIPFVRFMACGFWPVQMKLYFEDKDAYYAIMDDIVTTAERTDVGLIPSLFWYYACVPDMMGEPINQWGNPDSKTHAFMRQYTREMVTRYRHSPAIWAWEFGNEYNLSIDLPNAMDNLAWIWPHLGTPETRGEDDVLRFEHVDTALRAFAEEVRKHDPHRMLSTGHAIPRPSAHHQRTELSWKRDSRDQYQQVLRDQNPDPYDSIGIHVYPKMLDRNYFGQEHHSYEDVLRVTMEAARQANKAVFVGEFGAPDGPEFRGREDGNKDEYCREKARERNKDLFRVLLDLEIPLSNYWVYDFDHQEHFINVTSTNHRSYVLDMLREANKTLRERMAERAALSEQSVTRWYPQQ